MASNSVDHKHEERRKQVLIGNLPTDFLRIEASDQQQQLAADEQAALALQQQLMGFTPPNVVGRLAISVVEARLNKNYGVTRMDPYVRLRMGLIVYETPTDYNGAKNPKWNKVFHCLLPSGLQTVSIELYDECAFTLDERIAWAQYNLPEHLFKGETCEEWIQLSGKLGEGKEGTLNVVFSFTPFAPGTVPPAPTPMYVLQAPNMYVPGVMPYCAPNVYPVVQYPAGQYPPGQYPPGQYPPGQVQMWPPQQPQVAQTPTRPTVYRINDDDIKQVAEMFPTMDKEVVKTVLESNRGNKDLAINALLQMNSDS